MFWAYRPFSDIMIRAAADDVRFLLHIYDKMLEKLNPRSKWCLAVRSALYCRCFCVNDNNYADWPPLPPIPGRHITNTFLKWVLTVLDTLHHHDIKINYCKYGKLVPFLI